MRTAILSALLTLSGCAESFPVYVVGEVPEGVDRWFIDASEAWDVDIYPVHEDTDVTVVFVDPGQGDCGLTFHSAAGGGTVVCERTAVVHPHCGSTTLAHELGHVLQLGHQRGTVMAKQPGKMVDVDPLEWTTNRQRRRAHRAARYLMACNH